jgi:hypothetical protein
MEWTKQNKLAFSAMGVTAGIATLMAINVKKEISTATGIILLVAGIVGLIANKD